MVPESPAHHLCWVPQVVLFFNQFGGMTNIFGFAPSMVMGIVAHVPVCMCQLQS